MQVLQWHCRRSMMRQWPAVKTPLRAAGHTFAPLATLVQRRQLILPRTIPPMHSVPQWTSTDATITAPGLERQAACVLNLSVQRMRLDNAQHGVHVAAQWDAAPLHLTSPC
jgi:hypothetical protein